jgi:hypothetical protein
MIDRDWGSGHPDLEAASKAPRDLEGLLKDKATAELIRLFRSEGVDLVENYDRLNELLPKVSDELQERFNDSSYAAARKLIQSFRVARVIREKYRMDPAKMVEIEKRYAPMDWRLPEPHAIYWAMVAVENRLGWGTEKEKKDTIDARRNICFSVETLYRRGTIVYMDKQPGGAFQFGMNLDFLDPYDRELGALVAEYTRTWERGAETIGDAQMNFWKEAMMMLYFAGQRTRALDFYSRLQKSYDRTEFRIYDIDSYVLGQIEKMVEEWGRTDKVEYMVDGILLQAYTYAVLNKPRLADNYGEQARRIWEFYRKDYLERKIHKEERSVKTFEELKKVVADRILAGQYPNVPPNIVEGLRQLLSEEKSGAAKTPPTSAAP